MCLQFVALHILVFWYWIEYNLCKRGCVLPGSSSHFSGLVLATYSTIYLDVKLFFSKKDFTLSCED